MTDEKYVYHQDIREKKSAGRGAFHKKNGSKSKKCTFPSDYLTKKERQQMNGECISYDMKKFYSYEEFKQMPDDLALQYINGLINRYDIGIGIIAQDVFSITRNALIKYLEKHGLREFVNKSPTGGAGSKGRIKLISAMSKTAKETSDPIVTKEEIEHINEPAKDTHTESKAYANCRSMQVVMDGFDEVMLDFMKTQFVGHKIEVRVTVDVFDNP